MKYAIGFVSLAAIATAALAGEAQQVPHGMEVTTDGGQKVRVLAYQDGTFRVTVADDLTKVDPSYMVITQPDGSPQFASNGATASLATQQGSAIVGLSDGRLTVYDRSGNLLLDEYAKARSIQPVTIEGQNWNKTRVQFNRGTDEGLYGLGQHQNRQMNYNGEDVELAQHNMDIAIPYMVSTRGYGILWDNNSITRVGDPEPYEKLALNWSADYFLGQKLVLSQSEKVIDYQYIRDQKRWPEKAKAETVAATTGQNTAGNAVETQGVVWTGDYTPEKGGKHKFRLYSSSYVKVFADGKEVLNRWRQNWNPWYHNFELDLEAGKPVKLQVEWEPNQGYIALYHADPLSDLDRHSVSFASDAGKAIDYYVVPAPTMDDGIAGYRRLTGKAPMMPRWAYGFWQSRQRYNTQDEVTGIFKQYRDAGIPIDTIVQDWFYWPEDAWGSHDFDKARFPDAGKMVRDIHGMNGKIMISVWPKFYPTTENAKELAAKNYLYERPIEAGQLDWVGKGYLNTYYDPYAKEARDIYYRQIRDKLVKLGFDAWWMDATEPDWHSNLSVEERAYQMTSPVTGATGAAIFNSYPLLHAQGVAEGLRLTQPNQRPFILTRSGFGGVQRASAALWSGDVAARWDDLRDQISAGLNLSVAGVPNWTHDIGGFAVEDRYSKELPSDLPEWRELYTRWFQFGVYSPLFRSHGEFPLRETPIIAKGDKAMYDGLVHYHKLRYRMMPYIYTVAAGTYYKDGTIIRPLVMDFEADRKVWDIDDEYMFGPSLLIAPVTEFKARQRTLYLPEGSSWIEVETGTRYNGGEEIRVNAPRERIPVFAKAGAMIPMGPDVQYTSQNPQGPLTIHVFTGANGSFTLYEDQGENMGYDRGEYAQIPMNWDDSAKVLRIGAREGKFPGMLTDRKISVVLHDGSQGGDAFAMEPVKTVVYRGQATNISL